MVRQRASRAGWPRRVAGGMVGCFGMGVPQAQVFENAANDGGLVDDGDQAHGAAAFRALQRVHFVDFLDEAGPGGSGVAVGRGLVEGQGGGVGLRVGRGAALPPPGCCTSRSSGPGVRICRGCGRAAG